MIKSAVPGLQQPIGKTVPLTCMEIFRQAIDEDGEIHRSLPSDQISIILYLLHAETRRQDPLQARSHDKSSAMRIHIAELAHRSDSLTRDFCIAFLSTA